MMKEALSVDVSADGPTLRQLAEEVRDTHHAFVLRIDGDDAAVLVPVDRAIKRKKPTPSAADIAAFEAAFGGWKDVDIDAFLRDNAESRRISSRPPVEL